MGQPFSETFTQINSLGVNVPVNNSNHMIVVATEGTMSFTTGTVTIQVRVRNAAQDPSFDAPTGWERTYDVPVSGGKWTLMAGLRLDTTGNKVVSVYGAKSAGGDATWSSPKLTVSILQ